MTVPKRALLRAMVALAALAVLGSCSTINRFDRYSLEGETLRAEMRMPPEPRLDISYSVSISSRNPIGTALSVGSTIIKASEAQKAEKLMREALSSVDVPAIVLEETSQGFASALRAGLVGRGQAADYHLDLEIHEYGIEAPSWASAVSLHLSLTPSLYHTGDGKVVWRRKGITVDVRPSAQMFGMGQVANDLVTAVVLSTLTVEQLEEGFRQLALESARVVVRRMEDDYYRKRYR